MNILDRARRLEATLARKVEGVAQQWTKSGPRGPLEVLHAIVDAVADRLEPAGRGTHLFPFNRIKVSILAASRDDRSRFAALVSAPPTLQERVNERLRNAGCDPSHVQIRVVYVDRPAPHWTRPDVHVEFERLATQERAPEAAEEPDTVKVTVVNGVAEKPSYALALSRINLGRCAEVRDSRHRLIRTNHVAFSETGSEPNSTVSRRHAHIQHVPARGEYRICDDGSAHGTGIIRHGRTINVPTGVRGIRLRSGDEVVLGDARVRVKFGN